MKYCQAFLAITANTHNLQTGIYLINVVGFFFPFRQWFLLDTFVFLGVGCGWLLQRADIFCWFQYWKGGLEIPDRSRVTSFWLLFTHALLLTKIAILPNTCCTIEVDKTFLANTRLRCSLSWMRKEIWYGRLFLFKLLSIFLKALSDPARPQNITYTSAKYIYIFFSLFKPWKHNRYLC